MRYEVAHKQEAPLGESSLAKSLIEFVHQESNSMSKQEVNEVAHKQEAPLGALT